jgi:hypothetical protein
MTEVLRVEEGRGIEDYISVLQRGLNWRLIHNRIDAKPSSHKAAETTTLVVNTQYRWFLATY